MFQFWWCFTTHEKCFLSLSLSSTLFRNFPCYSLELRMITDLNFHQSSFFLYEKCCCCAAAVVRSLGEKGGEKEIYNHHHMSPVCSHTERIGRMMNCLWFSHFLICSPFSTLHAEKIDGKNLIFTWFHICC